MRRTARRKGIEILVTEEDKLFSEYIYTLCEKSAAYAEQVSGEVRTVIGAKLRPGNTWENVELPRLMSNPNVTKITIIDSKTGIESVIWWTSV